MAGKPILKGEVSKKVNFVDIDSQEFEKKVTEIALKIVNESITKNRKLGRL